MQIRRSAPRWPLVLGTAAAIAVLGGCSGGEGAVDSASSSDLTTATSVEVDSASPSATSNASNTALDDADRQATSTTGSAESASHSSDDTDRAVISTPSVPAEGDLVVSVPIGIDPPVESFWNVVTEGSGAVTAQDDLVDIHYEMVAWSNGEVVESTVADGEPLTILLGAADVPQILESAVFGQPVGTRLMVVFQSGLPDLPGYLDPEEAYVLAVDIVASDR